MARATGRDVIVRLMEDVDQLKENQATTTQHLEKLGDHVEKLAEHLQFLVKTSKDSTKRFDSMARTLSGIARVLEDHEERLSKLEEARQ